MQARALTPARHDPATELATRLHAILVPLCAAIARLLLRDPRHVALILPLCRYLTRTGQRFARLMARLAAGTVRPRPGVRPHCPTCVRPTHGHPARVRLPTGQAWLLHALRLHPGRHEVALATQCVERLLATPDAAAILAAAPQAVRLLRPLCRLLGVVHPLIPTGRRRRRVHRAAAASAGPEPAPAAPASPSLAEPCPRHPWPWPARPAPRPAPRRLLFDAALLRCFLPG